MRTVSQGCPRVILPASGTAPNQSLVADQQQDDMQGRTSHIYGKCSTPLEHLFGLSSERKPTALVICDNQYINWGLLDMKMDVAFVVPEDWLLLMHKIRTGSVRVSNYAVVGVAVAPAPDISQGGKEGSGHLGA